MENKYQQIIEYIQKEIDTGLLKPWRKTTVNQGNR